MSSFDGALSNTFLAPALMWASGRILGQEQPRTFHHHIRAHFAPLEGRRIFFRRQANFLTIDDQRRAIYLNRALEAPMNAVKLEHVRQVVRVQQIVDPDHLNVLEIFQRRTEHHASDAPKPVNTNFNCHNP